MWPDSYFAARYWPNRYFPKGAAQAAPAIIAIPWLYPRRRRHVVAIKSGAGSLRLAGSGTREHVSTGARDLFLTGILKFGHELERLARRPLDSVPGRLGREIEQEAIPRTVEPAHRLYRKTGSATLRAWGAGHRRWEYRKAGTVSAHLAGQGQRELAYLKSNTAARIREDVSDRQALHRRAGSGTLILRTISQRTGVSEQAIAPGQVEYQRIVRTLTQWQRVLEQANQPPRKGTKTEYIARVDDLVNQVKRMEDEAARRAARLLLEAQREITQRVITAEGWRLENLQSLQRQVNDILARFEREYTAALSSLQVNAYQTGVESVDEPLRISGVALPPARLNPSVIAVLQGFSADLIRNVSAETRAAVNATIAQSLLGLQSPFDAQRRIAQIVGARDNLRELTGISARAEAQFRTETGRVYSIATQARQEQVAELVPDLMKVWVATGDSRTRRDHLRAHGQTVKVDEFFEVGGEKLRFPRDPRGSAGQTINCRCRAISWREGYGEAVPRTTARVEKERERRANEFAWTH